MSTATGTNDVDADDLDEVDARALTQYLSVLDDVGRARDAPGLFVVVSESGSEYLVDACQGACECPDRRERRCKHLRRVAFATGARPIPAWVDREEIDDQLGLHVDGEPQFAHGAEEGGDEDDV